MDRPTQVFFDESTFVKKIPFTLTPTNLHGVYKNPVAPDSFDPNKASQLDLARYGLMWRKPGPGDPPEVQAAWSKFFSRKWLAADSIVPQSEPQVGVSHNLKKKPVKQADGNYLGGVWSGAGANTGTWSSIIGYWKIPTVSKPSEPQGEEGGWNSSSWLGLDGFFTSDDVLQAGVQQKVNASGIATYIAWYEWYAPQEANSPPYIWQTNIPNFPVSPGQQVYCSVQYNGTTSGMISFANETTGQHFSITLAPPPGATFNGSSYEWIMEAPDGGEPTSALPKFTPVTFTTALACNTGVTATANPAIADTLNIETTGGKVLTSVSVGSDTCTISFIG
jgi:Peptidase A4 family